MLNLIDARGKQLIQEFGKGFDSSNLRYMRLFYLAFKIRDAVRHELSWTHYRTLLKVESSAAGEWYIAQSVQENWSTRALGRALLGT